MTDTPDATAPNGYAVEQLTAADAEGMSPAEVVAAQRDGKFDRLLGKAPNPVAGRLADGASQLGAGDIEHMTPDEVVRAKAEGRFDTLLGRTPKHTYPANLW